VDGLPFFAIFPASLKTLEISLAFAFAQGAGDFVPKRANSPELYRSSAAFFCQQG
jgi:hypothetical protein